MRFLLAVLALSSVVIAQDTNSTAYLTAVLGALEAAGLTSLVSVASAIANTTSGMTLLGSLAGSNKTVFAPSNDAFANVSSAVSSNTTLLTEILSYHIVDNVYADIATAPNHTIAPTFLKGGGFSLPGGAGAPLVFTRSSGTTDSFEIIEAADNVTVNGNGTAAANLIVYVIDTVLTPPPTLSEGAAVLVPSVAGVLDSTGLLAPLDTAGGITVFAPNDDAIAAVMSALGTLSSANITTLLANHVINGSVVYSTDLASEQWTSAAGEAFHFSTNETGTYVSSGTSAAALIVRSDVIISNGVVHVIDGVLVNTNSDPAAASSAVSSASAAAATSSAAAASSIASGTGSGTATSSSAAATSSKASGAGPSMAFTNIYWLLATTSLLFIMMA